MVMMSEIKKAQNQSKFKAAFRKRKKKNKNYQIWFILANHISMFAISYNIAKL